MLSKYTSIFATLFICTVLFHSTAPATPIVNLDNDTIEDVDTKAYAYYQNSGEFMFFGGTDSTSYNDEQDFKSGKLETEIEKWLKIFDTASFVLTQASVVNFTNFTDAGDKTDSASKSGTWETTSPYYLLEFYIVKADNNYAVYYVKDGAATGSWSTYDLWSSGFGGKEALEISHFNGYFTDNTGNTSVPEPTTMVLFGAGLIGLAGLRRRRK